MKLALRNRKNKIMITPEGVRKAYRAGKYLYDRIKRNLMRKKKNPQTGIVVNYGRSIKRIPLNLSSQMKRGMKHCNKLMKQKLGMFKANVIQRANFVFTYAGEYKGNEMGKYDNDLFTLNFSGAKNLTGNYMYGGGLGFGRYDQSFGSNAGIANNCCFTNGNVFVCCLDIPTGYTLPSAFTGDFKVGGTSAQRIFGMYQQPILGGYELVALNTSEKMTTYAAAPLTIADLKLKAIYTLRYRYEFEFNNTSQFDYYVYVITFRMNHFKVTDTAVWSGLSNWLNYSQGQTSEDDTMKFLEGNLPSQLFKTVKVRKVKCTSPYDGRHVDQGTSHRQVIIKSNPDYLGVARRPNNIREGTDLAPDNSWYDESFMKYTYCMAFAVPGTVMYGSTGADVYQPIGSGQLQYRVRKYTKYCGLE